MNNKFDNEILLTTTNDASNSDLNKEKFKEKNVKLIPLFINYYKDALLMNAKEYENFLETSVKKLPTTLRINKMKYYSSI